MRGLNKVDVDRRASNYHKAFEVIACTAYWLLLACVTTKTCGTERRASEADSNTLTNDEAGSLLEFFTEFWGSLSYCVAAMHRSGVAGVMDARRMTLLTTMRRRSFVRGTTDGRERTQTMRHAFGIGVEQGGTGECGRNCGSESSKDSKDSGELHDK